MTPMTPEETAAAGEVIKAVNGWLEKLFGPAAKEAGGMLGDWLRDKREMMQRNRTNVARKVQTIMLEESVEPKEMSSKVLLPMLEGISVEDEDILQDMWANLFVNYIDSEKNMQVVVYPSILKQLSSEQVKILDGLYFPNEYGVSLDPVNFKELINHTDYGYEAMMHLQNIGLIQLSGEEDERFEEDYNLTFFGANFMKACKRKNKSE